MFRRPWRSRLRAHVAAFRSDRAVGGVRHAVVHRIRHLLDIGPVTTARIGTLTDEVDHVTDEVSHLTRDVRHLTGHVEGLGAHVRNLDDLVRHLQGITSELAERGPTAFEQTWAVTHWLEQLDVPGGRRVSVIMPTRGTRPLLLQRAVTSVIEQSYADWELLVVTDGDVGDVGDVAASLPADSRIHVLPSCGSGVSAARNTGLDHATGELVAYCDDDNTMGPHWLKAVVWAAGRHPNTEVFYGAQILEDGSERGIGGGSIEPVLALEPFDRRRLAVTNFVDQGTIAHRRGLAEARYDETLPGLVDWDFMVRLTAKRDPVVVPVVASQYSTSAQDRVSGSFDLTETAAKVRDRARSLRPIRVLAYNAMFPLLSETYIGDEVEALAQCGAEVAFCAAGKRSAPMPVDHPVFDDLDDAVARFDPDVLLLHWATFARGERAALDRLGLPYACRIHSFDADPAVVAEVMADPNCVGVWAYPHIAERIPGALALPALFTAHAQLPPPSAERDLVLSVSAGLPKKDWDLLLDAFARLDGVPRRIVIATTAEYEDLPTKLVLKLQEHRDPPLLQVNLTRDQVFSLLARAAVLVYTLDPGQPFGNPNSIVEALCSGACVVAPDRPEARQMIGSGFRGYRSPDDIVTHVREVLAGGSEIEAERERNVAHGRAQFTDAALAKRFHAELSDALAGWLI
jgi:glycosyltransferase involved in cell wall biosynthesis